MTKSDNNLQHILPIMLFLSVLKIPEDTDVAAYFEIMNNRGEQLQEHEILKALLTSEIKRTGWNTLRYRETKRIFSYMGCLLTDR